MAFSNASIRHSLIGLLADLVKNAGFAEMVFQDIASDLVFLLSAYREEELPLFPEVFLLDGRSDVDVLNAIAPAAERIPLGTGPSDPSAAAIALKTCAPLAGEGWSVFLEEVGRQLSIRRFPGLSSPVFRQCPRVVDIGDPDSGARSALA